jgi:hypothetical protein
MRRNKIDIKTMERKHKLTVPQPCHENWDKMTPSEIGRFCMTCSRTVVDFTSMLSDEIQYFFSQNQNDKICGRFRKSQLDSIDIQIPSQILYSQTNYRKIFLLALFVAMGTTLFSCQNKEGKKQKIDKVEIVTDTVKDENTIGKALINNKNSVHDIPPPPKVDRVKFVKPKAHDNLKSEKIDRKKNSAEKVAVYAAPAGEVVSKTNAEFPGGIDQFYTFWGKEFKKPKDINIKNLKINISFAVEKNGSMSYIQSDPVIDKTLENEIIRVLGVCPKWKPGELGGKKIKMQYSLPIVLQ